MQPKIPAQAGTLESSDALIMVEPVDTGFGRRIELTSSVMFQYGERVKQQITAMLDQLDVTDARIIVNDKGALDATICARVETAIRRSVAPIQEEI